MSTDQPKTPSGSNGEQQSADVGAAQENLRERAREVQERIEEGYHELEGRYDDARMQLRQANDTAVEFIRENPVLCIAGAIGVGYVVGRLASRRWLT
jgi:ElaB/YqjD/DUF883 family membrane-anchored ribosome-binding protein